MYVIRTALPTIAAAFPLLAEETSLMGRMLAESQGCLVELPTPVLLAGFEVIARTAGIPTVARRGAMEAAVHIILDATQKPPGDDDLVAAVRVWGIALARAAQHYGASVATSHTDSRHAPRAHAEAVTLATFMTTCAIDLRVLTAASEERRCLGTPREQSLAAIRLLVARDGLQRRGREKRQENQLQIEWETL